ncbi:XRE family transcriptional regulator [Longimycelium tulufanense]|uniref:XRE family transcriptional regulator n=1 Tax=Longimycelium tulufanense TaxID=907463 RepID=UPI00166B8593|nr:XRE family transcriptional regulator [Longimycelium tulufanense]
MSRQELAELVNVWIYEHHDGRVLELDGNYIGKLERGVIGRPQVREVREALRALLNAKTDRELGFYRSTYGAPSYPRQEPPAARLPGELEVRGADGPSLLADFDLRTALPATIGSRDVEYVRMTTRAFAQAENLFGGGLASEAALSQLRWSAQLLDRRASNEVRRAMFEAVGNLAGVVAFAAFDVANFMAAERCFRFALWCAEQGDSWLLRASTRADMARMAAHVGQLDEALSLIDFAGVRADRLTATTRAMVCAVRAQILARTARNRAAYAEVERADEHFADAHPPLDPPWLCYYDRAEHLGSTGRALTPAAAQTGCYESAASRLRAAIELQRPEYVRSRVFSRLRLATLIMQVADPAEAVQIARQALDDAAPLRSRRVLEEMGRLAGAAQRHRRHSEVTALHHDLMRLSVQS